MKFELRFTEKADQQIDEIESNPTFSSISKALSKTLGLLSTNVRHPSLKTHKYDSITGPNGEEVFEAYAQNNTPGAFRVFWYYGPKKEMITILSVSSHP